MFIAGISVCGEKNPEQIRWRSAWAAGLNATLPGKDEATPSPRAEAQARQHWFREPADQKLLLDREESRARQPIRPLPSSGKGSLGKDATDGPGAIGFSP